MSIQSQIWVKIRRMRRGEPFTAATFHELGSRAARDQALSRLTKVGKIARVARGIYARPEQSEVLGALPVSGVKVAQAIARAAGVPLMVSGAEAANRLGLSTQVPSQKIYLTAGSQRTIRLGRAQVFLKRVSPRRVVGAGTEAGVVLSALRYLGKGGVTEETVAHLRRYLPEEVQAQLGEYIGQVPAWMTRPLSQISEGQISEA